MMEKYVKRNNKWVSVGLHDIVTEVWAVQVKEDSKFIYLLNKYKDNSTEEVRYRKNILKVGG